MTTTKLSLQDSHWIERDELKRRLGLSPKLKPTDSGMWAGVNVPGRQDLRFASGTEGSMQILDDTEAQGMTMQQLWNHGFRVKPVGFRSVGRLTVLVRKAPTALSHRSKSSDHRVFVLCPYCHCEIPAGRLGQHVGTKTCHHGNPKPLLKETILVAALNRLVPTGEIKFTNISTILPIAVYADAVEEAHGGAVGTLFRQIAGLLPWGDDRPFLILPVNIS